LWFLNDDEPCSDLDPISNKVHLFCVLRFCLEAFNLSPIIAVEKVLFVDSSRRLGRSVKVSVFRSRDHGIQANLEGA